MKFLAHLFFWIACMSGGLGLLSAQFRLALPIISFGLVVAALLLSGVGFFLSMIAILRADSGRSLLALYMLLQLPCLALVGYGVWYGSQHPINDVTTDTVKVPEFIAPLALVSAVSGAEQLTDAPTMQRDYNPSFASIQKGLYGGISPSTQKIAPEGAFAAAKKTIRDAFPDWKIVKEDEGNFLIQAEAETGFFHFVDDVVIRITALPGDSAFSRVDVRSRSRYGKSDFGLNAKRITRFMLQLSERVTEMAADNHGVKKP